MPLYIVPTAIVLGVYFLVGYLSGRSGAGWDAFTTLVVVVLSIVVGVICVVLDLSGWWVLSMWGVGLILAFIASVLGLARYKPNEDSST